MTKKLDLLKKLHALSTRGVGGEKENAQAMLDGLLKKLGMTEDDLDEEIAMKLEFKLKGRNEKLLMQCMASVVGKDANIWKPRPEKSIYLECTMAQYLEITAKINFYQAAFDRELKIFTSAFIQANRIFSPEGMSAKANLKLTEEDLRMLKIAENIERRTFHRQLTDGVAENINSNIKKK